MSAALHLFADRGFAGTSVPDIAREAEIGAGTMYRYFASKEVLVNALYQEWKSALMSRLLTQFNVEASPREQFHELWTRLGAFVRDHPRAFAFLELHHHGRYLDEDSQALEQSSLRPLLGFVELARAQGVATAMPAEALIAVVWGAFVGLVKAASLGYFTLSDQLLLQTEACIWTAISASSNDS